MNRRTVIIAAVVWMLLVAVVGSSAVTLLLSDGKVSRMVSEEEYEMIERYRRLDEVRKTLVEDYYVSVDEDALVLGAVRGMMDSLDDPYTFYYTPEELLAANNESEGVYHGVGMVVQITEDGYIEVIRVYEDAPAQKAGIRAGDRIVEVDGHPVSGESAKTLNEAVMLIQGDGKDGTSVCISVLRDGEIIDLAAVRSEVNISYVEYSLIGQDTGYINIAQFTGNDVTGFEEAMEAFKAAGVTGVVVDLRDNPGGLLDDVVKIADMVLPEGLITYVEDRQGNRFEEKSDNEYWDIPMVVLVNDMSASASELFTAAFKDHNRGTVIGTRTFGKGIVQTLITFSEDNAGMQLTTASYFSPAGKAIHGEGVAPDVVVEPAEGDMISFITPDPEKDFQLRTALEELEKLVAEYENAA